MKNWNKRILSIALTLALVAGLSVCAAAAGAPKLPKTLDAAWLKNKPSNQFDPDLALVCAYANEKRGDFEKDYFKLLYRDEPAREFFGLQTVHIGHVTKGGETLVVLRLGTTTEQWGTVIMGYMVPWWYNVGYEAFANKAWTELEVYLSVIGADAAKTKLLITGHSAGGAAANIIGERLAKNSIAGQAFSAKNVYIYTFETPPLYSAWLCWFSFFVQEEQYSNIINLINTVDPTAQLLPGERFGQSLYFTCTQPGGQHAHAMNYEDYKAGIAQAKPMERPRVWPFGWFTKDFWLGWGSLMGLV